jgi:hypothetical protein
MSDDIRIVHMTADGRCAVTQPAKGYTVEQVIESLRREGHEARIPDGVEPLILPASEIPGCTVFRAARKIEGKRVVFCMNKAREIHRGRIRAARVKKMADLDAQFIRNLETGGENKAIAAEKQRLRDAPAHPSIEAAKTVEDLKAAWPL